MDSLNELNRGKGLDFPERKDLFLPLTRNYLQNKNKLEKIDDMKSIANEYFSHLSSIDHLRNCCLKCDSNSKESDIAIAPMKNNFFQVLSPEEDSFLDFSIISPKSPFKDPEKIELKLKNMEKLSPVGNSPLNPLRVFKKLASTNSPVNLTSRENSRSSLLSDSPVSWATPSPNGNNSIQESKFGNLSTRRQNLLNQRVLSSTVETDCSLEDITPNDLFLPNTQENTTSKIRESSAQFLPSI